MHTEKRLASAKAARNGSKIVYTKVTEETREIDPQLLEVEIANLKVQRAALLRQVEELDREIEALQAAANAQK